MRSIVKRCLVMLATLATSVALVPAAPAQASSYNSSSNPILFVHGWNSSASTWNTMISRFQANGWPSSHLRAISYDTSVSNATTAQLVAQEVDRLRAATGKSKVDIVTHSMGGLSTRYYLKNISGAQSKVDRWVSLGGPNHGTTAGSFCFSTACVEMRNGSTFLNNLNYGDETPGTPTYGTFWSECDGIIVPATSTILSGANNRQLWCLGHTVLTSDAGVYTLVRDFINP